MGQRPTLPLELEYVSHFIHKWKENTFVSSPFAPLITRFVPFAVFSPFILQQVCCWSLYWILHWRMGGDGCYIVICVKDPVIRLINTPPPQPRPCNYHDYQSRSRSVVILIPMLDWWWQWSCSVSLFLVLGLIFGGCWCLATLAHCVNTYKWRGQNLDNLGRMCQQRYNTRRLYSWLLW